MLSHFGSFYINMLVWSEKNWMLAKEGWEIYTRDYVDCVIVNNDPIYQLNDGLDWIDFFEWAQNGQQQKCEKKTKQESCQFDCYFSVRSVNIKSRMCRIGGRCNTRTCAINVIDLLDAVRHGREKKGDVFIVCLFVHLSKSAGGARLFPRLSACAVWQDRFGGAPGLSILSVPYNDGLQFNQRAATTEK